ncbi:MAG: ABC transporter substrate-binding protein, partial [Clostridiales bacterium]|nr:ABC transporter substrate-binding protein [Clostridiales bacterium]
PTDPTKAPDTTTPQPGTTDPVAPAVEKVHRTYMGSDCPILNGHDSVESTLQTPHDYCSSPLFRRYPTADGKGFEYIGDLAAELPIKIDDNNWQIKIRPEACWQNGDPINADTIMYSFKMQLDPILANQMADFLSSASISILNARDYSLQGTANTIAWETVGIKKIDEYTIQITTVDVNTQSQVCSQFTDRSCFPVYEPYYEAGMNDTRTATTYGTTLDNWMGCGPYYFDTWEFDSMHVYVKNPDHWLADLFHYDRVEVRIIPEMNARVELWEQGLLNDFLPDANTIETYIDDPRMVSYPTNAVYHIDINCKNPSNPLSGLVSYRKALYHAMNREVIARDIFGYMEPTGTYVSGQAGILSESKLTYRESEYGQAVTAMVESWGPYGYNPELALEYFNTACTEAGVGADEVITIILAVGDSDTAWQATAEYLKEEFPKIFGGRLQIDIVTSPLSATEFKKTGDDKWDLSPNDWSRTAARIYPYQVFYYYLTSYGTSPNNYFVQAFDDQFAVCDSPEVKADYTRMLQETQKLEEIYLEYVIHIPVVQDVAYQMFADHLQLPVETYIPGFGWGTIYGDIITE